MKVLTGRTNARETRMPLDWALDKVKSRRGEEEGRGRGGERGSPENDVTGWWLLFIEDMTEDHGVEVELS